MREPTITIGKDNKKYVLFFGERNVNGECSNWFKSPFTINNTKFSCVEQYMMYRKALTFGDVQTAEKVLKETSQREMKKLGRQVKNYDNNIWGDVRYDVVYKGALAKFTQSEELFNYMTLASQSNVDYFVECSPYDDIWGVKLPITDERVLSPETWNGQNLLGKVLMQVCDTFKKGSV